MPWFRQGLDRQGLHLASTVVSTSPMEKPDQFNLLHSDFNTICVISPCPKPWLTCTFKLLCGCGEQQLALHALWASAASNAGLFVAGFHPVREPTQAAVTVQGVGTDCPGRADKRGMSLTVLLYYLILFAHSFWLHCCSTSYHQQMSLQPFVKKREKLIPTLELFRLVFWEFKQT